jgi:hypothetical protein
MDPQSRFEHSGHYTLEERLRGNKTARHFLTPKETIDVG